ncbi:MAG: YerC/YecD family TrpR-related protein [Bacillota bacterium]|nr:YerC/YecD family TrpR-related protein [Bacillota bacterium]
MTYTGRLRGLPGLEQLLEAVLALRDVEECYRFFDDLCTVAELKAMSQRFAVAGLILQGAKYDDIERATGASSATISRVKRFVEYGSGGYQLAHARSTGEPE